MRLVVQKSESALAKSATQWLAEKCATNRVSALFLPAGNTPRPLYALWRQYPPPELAKLRLLQMDEIVEGEKSGLFQRFFRQELPGMLVEAPGDVPVQGSALAILGLGMNGHVAFHEPSLPRDFAFGDLGLDSSSARELGLPAGTRAKSYGLGTFLKCPSLLLLVTGEKKKEIFARFLAKDPALPVSFLHGHPDLSVFIDQSLE